MKSQAPHDWTIFQTRLLEQQKEYAIKKLIEARLIFKDANATTEQLPEAQLELNRVRRYFEEAARSARAEAEKMRKRLVVLDRQIAAETNPKT